MVDGIASSIRIELILIPRVLLLTCFIAVLEIVQLVILHAVFMTDVRLHASRLKRGLIVARSPRVIVRLIVLLR